MIVCIVAYPGKLYFTLIIGLLINICELLSFMGLGVLCIFQLSTTNTNILPDSFEAACKVLTFHIVELIAEGDI